MMVEGCMKHQPGHVQGVLKGKMQEGLTLLEQQRYDEVIRLWEPMSGNPFFHITHEEWTDKPYFRCQIQAGKSQLFLAHIQLMAKVDWKENGRLGYTMLKEVLDARPYAMKGGTSERLPEDAAWVQNLNYQDTLNYATEWIDMYNGVLFPVLGISDAEIERIKNRITQRLGEIAFLIRRRDERG
jgi:hypothetical protein